VQRISLSAYIARVATHGNVIPFPDATLNSLVPSGVYSHRVSVRLMIQTRKHARDRTRESASCYCMQAYPDEDQRDDRRGKI